MPHIKKILLSLAITLSTHTVFAADGQQQTHCPSVATLQTAGIDLVERESDGTWHGCKEDKLGTKAMWIVIIGPVNGDTDAAALKKANTALGALTFKSESNSPPWPVCEYDGQFDGMDIVGLAMPEGPEQPLKRSTCHMFEPHLKR